MQEQRNSIDSIPEPVQLERGSNSNSSGMDQSFYRSNPMLTDYLLPSHDSNIDYLNVASEGTDHLRTWNSTGPNSSGFSASQGNHSETKMAHCWSTTLSINSPVGSRMEETHHERTGMLPSENMDLNLNNAPVDEGPSFTQNLNLTQVSQSGEKHAEHAGSNRDFMEVSMSPYLSEYLEFENAPTSISNVSSCSSVGQVSEDGDGRARRSLDVRRVSFKRKSTGGINGECSASPNISADTSMPTPPSYLPPASFFEQTQSISSMHREVSSEWCPPSWLPGNAETSQRNFCLRINPACQYDVSTSQTHSSMMSPPSSVLNPFVHSSEHSQPHVLPVAGLTLHVQQSPSSSRIGSSSSLSQPQRRLISSNETNLRSLLRNGILNHPSILMRANIDHLALDSPNWNHPNSSLSMSANVPMTSRASSSSGGIPLPGTIMVPSETPVQHPRNLSEIPLSSFFPYGGSESGHHTSNLSSWHSRPASTQEPGQSSRSGPQGRSSQYTRSAISVEQQRDGVSGLPLSIRSRDGRNRMIYEIRNALDLMRRGGNLRFEDLFILEQSGLYGRGFYDRHRDMRLDVDNMSYEELLELEERIGYVSTGLSEDTILKRLKQRKHLPCKLEVASAEQEPCCICREEYIEEEDIGTLECRHDFHSACIKQWLMLKNLCPICKTTALLE